MRIGLTLVLLVANLCLFGIISTLRYREKVEAYSFKRGVGLDTALFDDLVSIEIKSPQLPSPRILKKEERQWVLIEPIEWPANPFAIQRILGQLEFMEREVSFPLQEVLGSGQNLADYGLEKPILSIVLNSNKQDAEILLGEISPTENRIYVLTPNKEEILVVSRDLLHSLLVELEDLRSPQLFSIPPFEVTGLSLQFSRPSNTKIRLEKIDTHWFFEAPFRAAADDRAVNAKIAAISALPITEFTEERANHFALSGLDSPSLRISLEGFHRKETLLIGNSVHQNDRPPQVYACLEGSQTLLLLPAELIDSLNNAQESLRQKHFLKIEPPLLTEIEIKHAEQSIQLEHLETGLWQLKSDNGQTQGADEPVVEDLINDLSQIEALRFVSDAPSAADLERWGLQNPQRIVQLKGPLLQTLMIGEKDTKNGLLYAKLQNSPSVYGIDSAFLEKIPLNPLHYRARFLNLIPKTQPISSLSLYDLKTQKMLFTHTLKSDEDSQSQWKNYLETLPQEGTAIEQLLNELHGFRVKFFLDGNFNSLHVLNEDNILPWRYRLEAQSLSSAHDAASSNIQLFFSERLDGQLQIGGDPHSGLTFALPQNWVNALQTLTTSE